MKTIDKLKLITERARRERKVKFTSLAHLLNEESLETCYRELKKDRASGVDEVSVEEYGEALKENLKSLVNRMKMKQYQPKPVRRTYIPKAGTAELRPLGIPSTEDKLVQKGLMKILEAIFEQDFLNCSHGFRPKRSCHTALRALDKVVMTKPINAIVEVDIEKFFDNVNHYWLLRCIEERVSDPNLLLLIRKFLKAGIVENGQWSESGQGTPQGGIVSPLLANIYLHFVLDLWFEGKFKSRAKGYVELIRYCDDFVVACESEQDAKLLMVELERRFSQFKLKISKEKTKVIPFGRKKWERSLRCDEKIPTFNFLGFTHYCGASRKGRFVMGHKTSKQNLNRKLKETKEWLKKIRNQIVMKEWWPALRAKLIGHYNYFGISGNMRSLRQFYDRVYNLVFKWINRRSQKKSMTRERYNAYLQWNPLPMPKIYHSFYILSPSR